jgi:hypothetical protein
MNITSMKTSNRAFLTVILALAVALSFGARAFAESPREELAHAYYHLKFADHDYNGHRVAAMHEVEAAGHELGIDLGGGGPGEERQWKSDRKLEEARHLLHHAREKLEARDRDRVAGHVEAAIREIDVALRQK